MPIVGITDRSGMFMEIGRIRKGEEKTPNAPGKNLSHFRAAFRPDEKEAKDIFLSLYGAEPRMINIRFAYPDIARNWDAYYEAHAKGGMIAQATGDVADGGAWKYYYDSESGQVHIRDYIARDEIGESLVKEGPHLDRPITTQGKPVFLKMVGKLKVVIPELRRVGHMVLVTTSIYDISAIDQELKGYVDMARMVNRTICEIPFILLRREEEITKKIDGKKVKGKDWMVHVIPSGEWTSLAMNTLNRLSLEEIVEGETRLLPAPSHSDENWDEDGEDFGELSELEEKKVSEKSLSSTPVPAASSKREESTSSRPYTPPVFKFKFQEIVREMPAVYEKAGKDIALSPANIGNVLAKIMDPIFEDKSIGRHITCSWLTDGAGSVKDMSPAQVRAFFKIMDVKYDGSHTPGFEDAPSNVSMKELRACYEQAKIEMKEPAA